MLGDASLVMARSRVPRDHTIGVILRAEREKRGDSQEAIAFRAGTTTGTVARVELGQSEPEWSTVIAIAEALELKLSELGARVEAARNPGT